MLKSIISVIVPIVMWGLLWVAGNTVGSILFAGAYQDQVPQSLPILLFFIAYSVGLSVLAGFICAKLAPQKQMTHVVILGTIQFLIGIGVQSGVWNQMPLWYHLIFLGLVIPAHLFGGSLGAKKELSHTG